MEIVKTFLDARAKYDQEDAKTVEAYDAACKAAQAAGFSVSPGDPKTAVISATARAKDAPNVRNQITVDIGGPDKPKKEATK